jgi:hypothetical protein
VQLEKLGTGYDVTRGHHRKRGLLSARLVNRGQPNHHSGGLRSLMLCCSNKSVSFCSRTLVLSSSSSSSQRRWTLTSAIAVVPRPICKRSQQSKISLPRLFSSIKTALALAANLSHCPTASLTGGDLASGPAKNPRISWSPEAATRGVHRGPSPAQSKIRLPG